MLLSSDVWGWVKYYREPHELTEKQAGTTNSKQGQGPSKSKPRPRLPEEEQQMEKTGLFEKKYLLENDTQLTLLHKQNLTLRKALAFLNESVALGLRVENWSAYPLGKVSSGGKMQFSIVSRPFQALLFYKGQKKGFFLYLHALIASFVDYRSTDVGNH